MSPIQPTDAVAKPTNHHLNRQIAVYALEAAAAGVGVLALTMPAAAEVVVTKTHLPITQSAPVLLDLNKDGVADLKFTHNAGATSYFFDSLKVCGALCGMPGNEVVGGKGDVFLYASALMRGAKIGPSANFTTFNDGVTVELSLGGFLSSHTTRHVLGRWGNDPQNRYVGVKFLIGGKTHFGWVRLTIISDNLLSLSGTITGYAYETIPNKPILAGTAVKMTSQEEGPSGPSLGMLASGADGFALWRRENHLT